MQIFDHFSFCQLPGHRLSRLGKGIYLQSLGFPLVPLVWGKTVSCKLCSRVKTVEGTLKTRKMLVFRLDALALSVIATATWLAGWLCGCHTTVMYQNH